jgi:hypothetical protein
MHWHNAADNFGIILERPQVVVDRSEATIHHQVERADVPRLVARQVEHGVGDVLGHGVDALEVGLAADEGEEVLECVVGACALGQVRHGQLRGHRVGRHTVDSHPVYPCGARPADDAGHARQRHDGALLPRASSPGTRRAR